MIEWLQRGPDGIRLRVEGKINPYLRVVRRRPDGFHAVELVLHSVDLADELEITPAAAVSVSCDRPEVPLGEANLAGRAAALLRQAAGERQLPGALIRIRKRIPVGAGMGGGSADAAAALLGLNELWRVGLDGTRLHELAAALGSDVPFFLSGHAMVGTGRGERLRAVDAPALSLVLVQPPFPVATGWAYQAWRRERCGGPSLQEFLAAYAAGDPAAVAGVLRNDLEPGVAERHPEVAAIRNRLLEAGALGARMTGSGSVVFGIAPDPAAAARIAAGLSPALGQTFIVRSRGSRAAAA